MGTGISEEDVININRLYQQVIDIQEYRAQLYQSLKNLMVALAPNLTILIGEFVGARIFSLAGSLMNLAKQPASTVQVIGANEDKIRHDNWE